MASVSDFLFQGNPPPNVNTNSVATTAVPEYLQRYHEGVLARGNALAAQPYQPYKGQRLADIDPSLTAGWSAGADAATSYQPYFAQAGSLLGQGAGISARNASAGSLGQAGDAFGSAMDYGSAGAGVNIAGAAQPYMAAAGTPTYSSVNAYMSPYLSGVVDQIGQRGQENLQQSLHTMGDDFIRAGGLGGSRHMSAAGKAMSDTQRAVSDAQSQALNQGYVTALGASQNDASRMAQLAQLSGNMANQQAQNQFQAGSLANSAGQGMAQVGQIEGNMASIDAKNTLDYANAQVGLGKSYQSAGLTGAAALEAIGRDRMGLEQQSLDLAYRDWGAQKDYNRNNTDWMATLTRGQPDMGGSVYRNASVPAEQSQLGPSGLGMIASSVSFANGLNNLFKAKGGYIDAEEAAPRRAKASGYVNPKTRPPPLRVPRRAA